MEYSWSTSYKMRAVTVPFCWCPERTSCNAVQIIQFIMAKTEHLPVVNVDPLTGGQSYVPRDDPSGPSIPLEDFPLTGTDDGTEFHSS